MATTDSRTGFRLPWSTDNRQASEDGDETRVQLTMKERDGQFRKTNGPGSLYCRGFLFALASQNGRGPRPRMSNLRSGI